MPEPAYEELRERLRQVEELAAEAVRRVPPRGWAVPGAGGEREGAADLHALLALLEGLRGLLPREVADQLSTLVRELLLLLRMLIDWYLERPGAAPGGTPAVEEIPID